MARPTIAMLVVFLLLAGGVAALNYTNPPPSGDTTVYVLDVKDADVERIDVQANAGSTSFDRNDPFGWKFSASGDAADLSRVGSVVNRLAKLRSSAKVTDNVGDLAPYGLNPPVDTAVLTMKDGISYRILIGGKTVNDAAYYAIVEGRPQLHTINTLVVGDLEKLVSDPPVPTPTPDPNMTATPTPEASVTPTRTPTPEGTPVATAIRIPIPGE